MPKHLQSELLQVTEYAGTDCVQSLGPNHMLLIRWIGSEAVSAFLGFFRPQLCLIRSRRREMT